jgi:hypothetical protein
MKMRIIMPAALAVTLTLVAGFYFVRQSVAPPENAPATTGSLVK